MANLLASRLEGSLESAAGEVFDRGEAVVVTEDKRGGGEVEEDTEASEEDARGDRSLMIIMSRIGRI